MPRITVACVARILAGALAILSVTAAAPVSATTGHDALRRVASIIAAQAQLRITAFGSSSTEGVGASSPAAAYPGQLERMLALRLPGKVIVLNRGIGGEDADDMALRLPAVLAERPDLVIWQTGSNDPLRGVPLDRFVTRTRAGIVAMRTAGIDVMLMEPQLCARLDSTPGADAFRQALRAIGDEMGVPVIRRFDLMRGWLEKGMISRAALLSADGLHMADAGYAMLAAEVAREILAVVHAPVVASASLR